MALRIRPAHELNFSPPPRCPYPGPGGACDRGIVPYGRQEPFVVDVQGRPFCREHGAELEPEYPQLLAQYRARLKAERRAAWRDLDEATQELDDEHGPSGE
jgi:hypothetical protein